MFKKITTLSFLILGLASLTAFTACEKKGPAEKAGEKVDDAADKAKDKMEEAGDKVEEATD